jgi:hypothetical protein
MDQREVDILLVQMQYPGMAAVESDICRAWIRQFARGYDALDFNVRLGKGRDLIEGLSPEIARQQTMLSQRRADVIAHIGAFIDILEVKDRATFGAIGQLRGYRGLWSDEHPQVIVRRLIVLARDIPPDVETIFRREGVEFMRIDPEARR